MWPGQIFIYFVEIDHPTDYLELKTAGQYILLVRAKCSKQSVWMAMFKNTNVKQKVVITL